MFLVVMFNKSVSVPLELVKDALYSKTTIIFGDHHDIPSPGWRPRLGQIPRKDKLGFKKLMECGKKGLRACRCQTT